MLKVHDGRIAAAVLETVEGFHGVGLVDKRTMRQFDHLCLSPPARLSGEAIRALREREQVSQAVFARCLNVSKNLVSDWGAT